MDSNKKREKLPFASTLPSLELERLEHRILLSAPVIQSLQDQPDPVHEGDILTLTARQVADPDGGQIVEVRFYRSDDGTFDAPAAGIQGNLYFWDANGNGLYDVASEDLWADLNANARYDAVDTRVYDQLNWNPVGGQAGVHGNVYFYDSSGDSTWDVGELVWAERPGGFGTLYDPGIDLRVDAGPGDVYEPNNTRVAATDLGTMGGWQAWSRLAIGSGDEDWFTFDLSADGASSNFVRIEFLHSDGNLDLELYDSTLSLVGSSRTTTNDEQISLNGVQAGAYYLRVYGSQGADNDNYDLVLNAPGPGDVLLGTGTQIGFTGDWQLSVVGNWQPDYYHYFALARDNGDGTLGTAGQLRFNDNVDTNGRWEAGEEIWLDADADSRYDPGEIQAYIGADNKWDTLPGVLGVGGNLLFQDVSSDGAWQPYEPIWADKVADGRFRNADDTVVLGIPAETTVHPASSIGKLNDRPVVTTLTGSPEPIGKGETLTLVASGVSDTDGFVNMVEFYHDSNNNGVWDAEDRFLRRDTDGSDGWSWTGVVQWTIGDYFARARDSDGGWSAWPDDFAIGHVNQKPIVGSVGQNPNPIVPDQAVTFTALNVYDPDQASPTELNRFGVATVQFWRDVFDSGHFNPNQDDLLNDDAGAVLTYVGGGMWRLTVPATWEQDISPLFFARARDLEGGWGNAVWVLNQNPVIDHVEPTPDPVTLDDPAILEALGVEDSDGFIKAVVFSVFEQPGIPPYTEEPFNIPEGGWPNDWYFDEDGTDGWSWTFSPRWTIGGIVMEDFDRDGDMDIAVAVDVSADIGPDFVSVLLNNGQGEFDAGSLVRLGLTPAGSTTEEYWFHQYDPSDISAGDVNNDGRPDLVVADSATDRVSVLLNQGGGVFTDDVSYEVDIDPLIPAEMIHPHAVTMADFNDDGNLDVAVASYIDLETSYSGNYYWMDDDWHGAIVVMFGDGTGAFATENPDAAFANDVIRVYNLPGPGLRPEDLVAADLDQDGFVDLAVVSQDGVLFLWNNGFIEGDPLVGFLGDPGGVIGRAVETGITGAEPQQIIYDYVWRDGFVEGPHATDVPPYYHNDLMSDDVDMFRVTAEAGASVRLTVVPVPWLDPTTELLACNVAVFDANGVLVAVWLEDDAVVGVPWSVVIPITTTGNYYIALGGMDPTVTPPFDPITGANPGTVAADGEYELIIDVYGTTYQSTEDQIIVAPPVSDPFDIPQGANDSINTPTVLRDILLLPVGQTTEGMMAWYGLNILPTGDDDWFQFDLAATAGWSDYARIDFTHAAGDLALELWAGGALQYVSNGATDGEIVPLVGYPAGTYQLHVYSPTNDQNDYDLILHLPGGPASGIQGNLYFQDTNRNLLFEPFTVGEDLWKDEVGGRTGIYDAGLDQQILDPNDWQPWNGLIGFHGNVYFYDLNGSGRWDFGEFIWADLGGPDPFNYDAGSDLLVPVAPWWVQGLAPGTQGVNGSETRGATIFFDDVNASGQWDAGEDLWADRDQPGGTHGVYDAGIDDAIPNPSDPVWNVPDGTAGVSGRVFFALTSTRPFEWDPGEAVWVDGRARTPDVPIGAGDSITAANFLEDNYDDDFVSPEYQNVYTSIPYGMAPPWQLLDIDIATANSQTNRASVLLGNHYFGWGITDPVATDIFLGLYPNHDRSAMAGPVVTGNTVGRYNDGRDVRITDADRIYDTSIPGYTTPFWNSGDGAAGTQGNVYFYDVNRGWYSVDGQRGIRGNVVFLDVNFNGVWDESEPVWADDWVDRAGNYTETWVGDPSLPIWQDTDQAIYGMTDWVDGRLTAWLVFAPVGIQTNVYFNDANANGVWDPGENVWADRGGTAGYYDAGVDVQIAPRANGTWDSGEDLWADNPAGTPGAYDEGVDVQVFDVDHWDVPDQQAGVQGNVYFRDANFNGVWNAGEDVWADMLTGTYPTGDNPVSITAYNIDADTTRQEPPNVYGQLNPNGDPDWWWGQGSVEGEYVIIEGEPWDFDAPGDAWQVESESWQSYDVAREPYIDLVTANRGGGTLTVLLNEGSHSGNFGILEGTWQNGANYWLQQAGDFAESSANYGVDDYLHNGPFDLPSSVMVSDFNADGVQDFLVSERLNVTLLEQAFPFHSSDPLALEPYAGEIAQVELPFGFAGSFSVIPGEGQQLTVTYYAQAFDEDFDAWNNPEYGGASGVVSTTLALNQRPLIWSLTANREVLSSVGDVFTLTADGVSDVDGQLMVVEFYRDDGDGVFEPTGDGVYFPQEDHLIVGAAPAPDTPGTAGRPPALLFADVNENGLWDSGEEIWWDTIRNGRYDDGDDAVVYDGGNGWSTPDRTPGISGNLLFWDQNANGQRDSSEPVWAEAVEELLGVDTNGSDGWTFSGPFDGHTETLYWARAIDNDSGVSLPAVTMVNERPSIAALYVDGVYDASGVADDTAIMQATDLGATRGRQGWYDLQIGTAADQDWFLFELDAGGRASDFVRIEFTHANGNLDIALYDQSLALVGVSNGLTNNEQITLAGLESGSYYLRVYGTHANVYDLILNTPRGPQTGIHGNVYFADDVIVNGSWNTGEDVWADRDSDGVFNAGIDTVIAGSPGNLQVGIQGNLYFYDANGDVRWAVGEFVWADRAGGTAQVYDLATDARIDALSPGIDVEPNNTALGLPVAGQLGIRGNVLFNDADFNRRWDPGEDVWHDGSGGGLANGVYDWEYQVYSGTNGVWNTLVGAAGTQGAVIFNETTGNGRFNWTEEAWWDSNANGRYDAGEAVIWNGGDGKWNTPVGTTGVVGNLYWSNVDGIPGFSLQDEVWADARIGTQGAYDNIQETQLYWGQRWTTEDHVGGTQGNILFNDANDSGGWNVGEAVWADEVFEHHDIVLTAVDVQSGQNSGGMPIRKVQFYGDSNYNGVFDPYLDQWLGAGVNVGDIRGGSADEWQFFVQQADWVESPYWNTFVDTVNWSPGSQTYFAVVEDFGDQWSSEAEARSDVKNIPPTVGELVGTPDPVTERSAFTLTALGVDDAYGEVDYVAFYREANGLPGLQPDEDQLLGQDADGTDGWSWSTDSVAWPVGEHTYMARALDNYGDWSETAYFVGTVHARPVFGGTFQTHPSSPLPLFTGGPVGAEAGDLNGDDLPDLVVLHDDGNPTTPGISVWLGKGDGTFVWNANYAVGVTPAHALLYDLNLDGNLDLLVTNTSGNSVLVMLGNGNGTFRTATGSPFAAGTSPVGLAVGEFNGDGLVDLAVTNSATGKVVIMLGTGLAAFGSPTAVPGVSLSGPVDIVTADFDLDGDLDLAVAERDADRVAILLGRGTGDFDPLSASPVGDRPIALLTADLNDDGVPDLAAANSGGNTVSLLFGTGDGEFESLPEAPDPVVGNGPSSIRGGYLDTDSRLDLVVTNALDGTVSVLLSNTRGEFAEQTVYLAGSGPSAVAVADFDLDSSGDLVVANRVGGNLTMLSGIPALTDSPDPVEPGSLLVLRATGLRDLDGDAISVVEFYRDSNANGSLDVGIDQRLDPDIIGADPNLELGVRYVGEENGGQIWEWVGPVTWSVGEYVYFVRAQDDRGGWSFPVTENGRVVNPAPVIMGGLLDQPDPVTEGYLLTLVAQDVIDANGTIQVVEFYRDSNGDASLTIGQDQLLGTNAMAEGNDFALGVVVNWAPGTHLYFARAQDDLGSWSDPVAAEGFVNGRPVIGTLAVSPNPVPYGDLLRLTAQGAADTDGGTIVAVAFYRDSNKDGQFTEGADELIGIDRDGGNGWSIQFPALLDDPFFFARAQDNMGGWSFATRSPAVNRRPVVESLVATPDPVTSGEPLRLEAMGVFDVDGYVDAVAFYRDLNGNGALESDSDVLLGLDTTPANGWSWNGIVTWPGGAQTYFAIARDNLGVWTDDSDAAKPTGLVNRRPTIEGGLRFEDPGLDGVITRGEKLTLRAVDVRDVDGVVKAVEFYRDTNFNGVLNVGQDTLLGYGTPISDDDWFMLNLASSGGAGDLVRIEFVNTHGDLDMELYNASLAVVGASTSVTDNEEISLNGRAAGTYYLRVYGHGAFNSYDLVLQTPGGPATGIQGNLYFADEDADGQYDPDAEDLWADLGGTAGTYNAGVDQQVSDPRAWETPGGAIGMRGNVYFFDANGNTSWNAGEFVWAEMGFDQAYEEGVDLRVAAMSGDRFEPNGSAAQSTNLGATRGLQGWYGLTITSDWVLANISTLGWEQGTQTFFARARDDTDAWSIPPVSTTGVVNVAPTVGALQVSPDPVTRGNLLTLVATGVGDPEGTVIQVVFYRDSNDNGTLDAEDGDQVLGTGVQIAAGEWKVSPLVDTSTFSGEELYFARAQDAALAWSNVVSASGAVNARPVIGDVTVVPDPIVRGRELTLTALGVSDSDPDGVVQEVVFYRSDDDVLRHPVEGQAGIHGNVYFYDLNGNARWNLGEFIWAEHGAPNGVYNELVDTRIDMFAIALPEPNESAAGATNLGATRWWQAWYDLAVSPSGDQDWFAIQLSSAGTASDLVRIEFTHADGDLDLELYNSVSALIASSTTVTDNEEISLNGLAAGTYYVRVFGSGGATNDYSLILHTPAAAQTGVHGNLYFWDENGSEQYEPASESLWADLNANARFDGAVDVIDDAGDVLLGSARQEPQNPGVWVLKVSTAAWPAGESSHPRQYFIFAEARDNDRGLSDPTNPNARTTVSVATNPPSIASLVATPEPLARGQALTLTAVGVTDPDGAATVALVEFYRDADFNGVFDEAADLLLGTDTLGGDGWQIAYGNTAGWRPELQSYVQTYFARARDADGAWSVIDTFTGEGVTTGTVRNSPPVVGQLALSPNPVAPGQALRLTASGVADVDGTVAGVQFYRDSNGDGVLTPLPGPGADEFLGVGTQVSAGVWRLDANTSAFPFGAQTYFARAQDQFEWGQAASAAGVVDFGRIATGQVHGAVVTFYDTNLSNGMSQPNIAWSWAQWTPSTDIVVDSTWIGPGKIAGIYLYGDGSRSRDLGIVVSGNRGLVTFADYRSLTSGPVGFLVVQGNVSQALFDNGLTGARLDGFIAVDGWRLGDIDEDGDPSGLTGLYSAGNVDYARIIGSTDADVVADGRLGMLFGKTDLRGDILAKSGGIDLVFTYGDLGGRISASAPNRPTNIGSIVAIGGDLLGSISATGSIGQVGIYQGSVAGGSITAGTGLSSVYVSGNFRGSIDVTGNLNAVSVGGSMTDSLIDVTGGAFPSLWVGGNISDTQIRVDEGLFTSLYAAGNFYNSSVDARQLSRVVVGGQIYRDAGTHVIHADLGTFFARDIDEYDTITTSHSHTFGGIVASVA